MLASARRVTTAGVVPPTAVSLHAPRLLTGTPVAHLLENAAPRPVSAVQDPALVVTIDCPPGSVAGTTVRWDLDNGGFDERCATSSGSELRTSPGFSAVTHPPSGWPAS